MTLERAIQEQENNRPDEEWLIDQALGAMANDALVGFCLACGTEVEPVEPDADDYECPECGALEVTGAEQILHMFAP